MNEKITEAVIYPDRALVTREIEIDFEPGEQRAFFKNLPSTLHPYSIRVQGQGSVPLKIQGHEIRWEFLEKAAQEKIRRVDEELEAADEKINFLLRREKNLQSYGPLFEKLILKAAPKMPVFDYRRPGLEEIQKFRDFLKERRGVHDEKTAEILKEKKQEESRKEKILQERIQIEGGRHESLQHCEVSFLSNEKGRGVFRLSYLVPDAFWIPFYEARLFFDSSELELSMFSRISQVTGEDWPEVRLCLSTASPSTEALLPPKTPWFIDFYQPVRKKSAPMMSKMKAPPAPECTDDSFNFEAEMEMKESAKLCLETPAPENALEGEKTSEQVLSSVSFEGLHVSFEVPQKESITSGNHFKKAAIDRKRFPVNIDILVMPRMAENAFLQVRAPQSLAYPLLAGEVFVFHGQNYIGKSSLESRVMPGGELKLFMGRDEEIKVKSQLLNRFQGKKGMLQNQFRIEHRYKTTLSSYKKHPVQVRVQEMLPVASHAQIKVRVSRSEPAYQSIDEKGMIQWLIELKPGEEKEIYFSFTVDYPEDQTLYGL